MLNYSFDEIIDHSNHSSIKFDSECFQNSSDVIPMWVADMDFRSPPEVCHAIHESADYGVYGYTYTPFSYKEAVSNWFAEQFHWQTNPDWILPSPNVLFGLIMALRVLTKPGDTVMIQEPVYYPFRHAIHRNNRHLVVNDLYIEDNRFKIDFDSFERIIDENNVKVFILCSPHNPGGRVWSPDELKRMGDILMKYHVTVLSDEIHADLVYEGHQHTVFASLNEHYAQNSIVFTSPTKTFNMAGLHVSNLFIPNRTLREQVKEEQLRCYYEGISAPAIVATETAYRHCLSWKNDLLHYLEININHVISECQAMGNLLVPMKPDGTILMWIDCRQLGLDDKELFRFFYDEAKIRISQGSEFGSAGRGFIRMNIACPHSVLQQAMTQLALALNNRRKNK